MLDHAALKELLTKKMVGPAAKREAVAHLRNVCEMTERRACTLVAARSQDDPVPFQAATRYRAACPSARPRQCAAGAPRPSPHTFARTASLLTVRKMLAWTGGVHPAMRRMPLSPNSELRGPFVTRRHDPVRTIRSARAISSGELTCQAIDCALEPTSMKRNRSVGKCGRRRKIAFLRHRSICFIESDLKGNLGIMPHGVPLTHQCRWCG